MKSFLVVGQSNMAGRGSVKDVPPIINHKCFMLRNGRWQPMSDPINPDRRVFQDPENPSSTISGISPSGSFADEYSKYTKERVGLIPCAYGGTSITEWMKGNELFDYAVMMTKLAMRTSELCGILWHQGESDSESVELVRCYHDNLIKVMTDFRKELGDVPIIMGELGDISRYKEGKCRYWQEINEIIRQVSRELPDCALASAEDLVNCPDNLHFNSQSSRVLGTRFFYMYKEYFL